jgi:chromosomal replication initiation ATPase DnaA
MQAAAHGVPVMQSIIATSSWTSGRSCHRHAASEREGSLRHVLEETVARVFDVDLEHIRLPTRGRARVATARQVAMYLAHVACGLTLTEAGDLFGRDRTTVAHACQVVEDRREDQDFDRAIELLENIAKVLAFAPSR